MMTVMRNRSFRVLLLLQLFLCGLIHNIQHALASPTKDSPVRPPLQRQQELQPQELHPKGHAKDIKDQNLEFDPGHLQSEHKSFSWGSLFNSSIVLDSKSQMLHLVLIVAGVALVFVALAVWCNCCCYSYKREVSTDRSKVLEYLHGFDVEDIELQHSATGGWHCAYVNQLAQGINKQASKSAIDASLFLYERFFHDNYDPLNQKDDSDHSSSSGYSLGSGGCVETGQSGGSGHLGRDEPSEGEVGVITFGSKRERRRDRTKEDRGMRVAGNPKRIFPGSQKSSKSSRSAREPQTRDV